MVEGGVMDALRLRSVFFMGYEWHTDDTDGTDCHRFLVNGKREGKVREVWVWYKVSRTLLRYTYAIYTL